MAVVEEVEVDIHIHRVVRKTVQFILTPSACGSMIHLKGIFAGFAGISNVGFV